MRQLKKPGEDRPGSGRPELEERAGSTRHAGGLTNPVEVCTKLTALHVFLPRSATGDLYTILTHWLARDCQYRVQIGHPREREGSRFATGEDAVHQKPSSDRVNCGYSERKIATPAGFDALRRGSVHGIDSRPPRKVSNSCSDPPEPGVSHHLLQPADPLLDGWMGGKPAGPGPGLELGLAMGLKLRLGLGLRRGLGLGPGLRRDPGPASGVLLQGVGKIERCAGG